uniref:Uncharacterized protein n=1 Tax=Arundo donax TaxID=35708 RepID=A0A0A8ZXG5_ARUDO
MNRRITDQRFRLNTNKRFKHNLMRKVVNQKAPSYHQTNIMILPESHKLIIILLLSTNNFNAIGA